jgi:hypothetical protein
MNLSASQGHDIFHPNSANGQRIANQRPMTSPRHRFGAHDGDLLLLCQANQFLEILLEFWRLHVIRVAAKGSIAPTGIERIAFGMTQATQTRQVNVGEAGFL